MMRIMRNRVERGQLRPAAPRAPRLPRGLRFKLINSPRPPLLESLPFTPASGSLNGFFFTLNSSVFHRRCLLIHSLIVTGRQVGEGERDPAADSGVDVASSGQVPGNFSKCTERPATTSNGDLCRKQYNFGSHSPRAKRNFKAQRAGVPVGAKRMNALARGTPGVRKNPKDACRGVPRLQRERLRHRYVWLLRSLLPPLLKAGWGEEVRVVNSIII